MSDIFKYKMEVREEENSPIDYFDVEEEFFLIDSNNLCDIKTKMYGFSVQNNGIFEDENMNDVAAKNLNGCGCYVWVEVAEKKITIKQDFNGSFGIYLYKKDEYFAISNSFFRLLDYVKDKYSISLNRDYANHIIADPLASMTYSETAVNEIELIDKNAVISIDVDRKLLELSFIDYKEDSFLINSREGLDVLDNWYKRWTTVFRSIKKHSNNMMVALSGGFDSRITFLLMLKSGINLSEIRVHSIDDKLHTHAEDYEIASSIADYYGFLLNNSNFSPRAIRYSLNDIVKMSFYNKMTFHKEMYFKRYKFEEKRYMVPGAGGESVRAHWDVPAQQFIEQQIAIARRKYSNSVAEEISNSIIKLIRSAYDVIGKKFKIEDDDSLEYPLNIHRENRCRSHFGKAAVEDYFSNTYILSPLIDPDLRRLKLNDFNCQDNNLLMAMIYVRYCPELLNFKFEGNRTISKETIEFAKQINERFPIRDKELFGDASSDLFSIVTKDSKVSAYLDSNKVNKVVPPGAPEKYFKSIFDSVSFRKLFATYFDEEIYVFAKEAYERNAYVPMRDCYSIIGLTKVIEDIMVNQRIMQPSLIQGLEHFIEQNAYVPTEEGDIIEKIINFITSRMDIKLRDGNEKAELELISMSDKRAKVSKPKWLQNEGMGYLIESYNLVSDFELKAITDGELTILFRSRFVRDAEGNRIPYWIDYTNITCGEENILQQVTSAWHDEPIELTLLLKAGESIKIHTEWVPHRSNTI